MCFSQRSDFFEMEDGKMHRAVLSAAATVAIITGAAMLPQSAEAMTLPAPAGIAAAVEGNTIAQDVAYVCRRVRRCGPYGCGWRRACAWTDSMVGGLGVTAVGAVGDLPIAFSFRIAAGCLPGPAACCSTANDVGGAGQVSG
jgi:hypothetical protein